MVSMLRFGIALLLAPALFGQLATDIFDKAPPPVDEALRARIQEFYPGSRGGKHRRRTEQLVAEDSKDYFYTTRSPSTWTSRSRASSTRKTSRKRKPSWSARCTSWSRVLQDKPLPVPTPSCMEGQWTAVVLVRRPGRPWHDTLRQDEGRRDAPDRPERPAFQHCRTRRPPSGRSWDSSGLTRSAVRIDPSKPFTDRITITNKMPGAIALAVTAPKVEGLDIRAGSRPL